LQAYLIRVATIEKVVSGFSSTGIYPVDPCKCSEDDFALTAGLIKQPTRVIHDAAFDKEQPINEAKKQQEASIAESTCSEEPVSELPAAESSGLEVHAIDISPVPTWQPPTSLAIKSIREKQHSEILTSAPMKAVFIEAKTNKLVHKKEGKLHERKARKFTQGIKRISSSLKS
jgi:hypothetical protein